MAPAQGWHANSWSIPYLKKIKNKKIKLNPYLTPYIKANSKCVRDLHLRAKITCLKKEDICELVLGKDLLD